jgi:hypothetical protein
MEMGITLHTSRKGKWISTNKHQSHIDLKKMIYHEFTLCKIRFIFTVQHKVSSVKPVPSEGISNS